ncbi:MAG: YicC/YloC family endoribonuclease [Bacteroidales bacterium]
MIKSMTGYGKSVCRLDDKTFNTELKTLNSKYFDINLRLPAEFRSKEQEIRSLLTQQLQRGKAELVISIDNHDDPSGFALNKPLMEKYYRELTEFAARVEAPVSENLIPAILRLPEVLYQETEDPDDETWDALLTSIREAIGQTDHYRITEGQRLEKDLVERIDNIRRLREAIPPLEEKRTAAIRQKLQKSLESLEEASNADPNRFEQELLYYLEKLDITEEMVRLEQHLSYFEQTLEEDQSSGKKLHFIAQELGREINTIGSKANDAGIQKIVVQMKDELEKIKEQLMNIL